MRHSSLLLVTLIGSLAACAESSSDAIDREPVSGGKADGTNTPLLACAYAQEPTTKLDIRPTSAGFEAVSTTRVYDPWDCRCEYDESTVIATYQHCVASPTDSRVLTCTAAGNASETLFTTLISRTQIPIGGTTASTTQQLTVTTVTGGVVTTREFDPDECTGR